VYCLLIDPIHHGPAKSATDPLLQLSPASHRDLPRGPQAGIPQRLNGGELLLGGSQMEELLEPKQIPSPGGRARE